MSYHQPDYHEAKGNTHFLCQADTYVGDEPYYFSTFNNHDIGTLTGHLVHVCVKMLAMVTGYFVWLWIFLLQLYIIMNVHVCVFDALMNKKINEIFGNSNQFTFD